MPDWQDWYCYRAKIKCLLVPRLIDDTDTPDTPKRPVRVVMGTMKATAELQGAVLDLHDAVGRPYTKTYMIPDHAFKTTGWPMVLKTSMRTKTHYNVNNSTIQGLSHTPTLPPDLNLYFGVQFQNGASNAPKYFTMWTYITYFYIGRKRDNFYRNAPEPPPEVMKTKRVHFGSITQQPQGAETESSSP